MTTKRRTDKVRLAIYVEKATYQQLQELAQALHVNQSAIVAQALARWHRVEPLVKDLQKQVAHGNSDSGV